MWKSALRKYKEVVLAVALFIALDAGVLVLNFYTSYQIADEAHAIQLASRQAMLSQRIQQSIYKVRDDLEAGVSVERSAIGLAIPFKQFDEVLDSFIYGGELIGAGQGQDSLLKDSNYAKENANLLSEIEKIWHPYRRLISPLVYAGYGDEVDRDELLQKTQNAINFSRQYGDQLLDLMLNFSDAVESVSAHKAQQLRQVQTVGIGLAIINFFLILFHFLRKLGRSDQIAERAQKETKEILDTVNDGLFLLGPDHKIGSQYSASMTNLFQRQDLAQLSLIELLRPLVNDKTLTTTKDFVDVLFNERVKSNLMVDLNPLREVELNITNEDGSFSDHHFSFEFSRVFEAGKLIHLLVTVNDITQQVELQRELKKSQKEASRDMDLLLSVIHIDPQTLTTYLHSFDHVTTAINNTLIEPVFNHEDYAKKLNAIYRLTHKLKGDSAAVKLDVLEIQIERMEEILSSLRSKQSLQGNDFLPLTVSLNNLVTQVDNVRTMVTRLSNLSQGLTGANDESRKDTSWHSSLQQLVDQVAEDSDKQVRLNLRNFNQSLIPAPAKEASRDALIQFIRNAIVHGLEPTDERIRSGKTAEGVISIRTIIDNGSLQLEVRDDGAGIDFKSVRQRLIDMKKYSSEAAEQLSHSALISWLFKPGFSTCDKAERHAGHGVGLDLVKNSLNQLNAKLAVTSKPSSHTLFKIRFPLEQQPTQLEINSTKEIA